MCTSCAWAKPAKPLAFEYCENGAKATAWEQTRRRATPDFFAAHTVTELLGWSDYALEEQGRLTHPMRYDAATDTYVPCEWQEAFDAIGRELADRTAGLVAAMLQAINPAILMLVHGYTFSDHVDISLLFWTELAIWLVVRTMRSGSTLTATLAGVAQALAFLSKTYPALIATGIAPATYVAAQGTALGRTGRVHVTRDGDDIWIGGKITACIAGTVTI
jgi:hypothetical protein